MNHYGGPGSMNQIRSNTGELIEQVEDSMGGQQQQHQQRLPMMRQGGAGGGNRNQQ